VDTVAARTRRRTSWSGIADLVEPSGVSVPRGPSSTLGEVAASGSPPTPRPPGRALLRIAGVLTQLSCGACLLIGTIGLVLVEQNRTGGVGSVAAWLVMAMAGLVFGGLIYRGGLVSMLIAAAIDGGFGLLLATFDHETLRRLLRILGASDVDAIRSALGVAGFAMIGAGVVCLVALPHGIRYARWFRDAAATRTAMSTARGFPPPPVPVRTATYIIPAEEIPGSRRRIYTILGGVAIGVGAGIGVLVSSTRDDAPATEHARPTVTPIEPARPATEPARPSIAATEPARPATEPARLAGPPDAGVADAGAVHVEATVAPLATAKRPARVEPAIAISTVQELVLVQHRAIARVDRKALAGLIAAEVFGFGTDAGDVAEGRDGVVAQLVRDLGDPPAGGFTVESKAISIGEDRGHAWIAEQLEVGGAGREARSFAVSELAAVIDGNWQVVALHWATPVDDATAQRLAVLSRLPLPARIVDRHDGPAEIDQAVRAAFASRAAFAEACSERADTFNYGSGGERAHGGAVKRIFSRLKADIRVHDGVRVVGGGAWDPAQTAQPRIAWAAVNVDYTAKTRAATEVTQTFRVLAILIKDGRSWKIVQTQWSNGGPIR
jgi:SnoaL-like domain